MGAVSTEGEAGTAPAVVRICAECGQEFQQRRRGRPSVYCRPACRQRAWALRQARATLDATPSAEPAPPVAPTPPPPDLEVTLPGTSAPLPRAPGLIAPATTEVRVPTDVRGWVSLLKQLRSQLNDPGSDVAKRPWEHARLYDSLGQALTALDAATPGGLAWLERND
jgi:hypothetical protein